MSGNIIRAAASFLVMAAFYALFAGQISPSEVEAGLPSAFLATVLTVLLRRAASRQLALTKARPGTVLSGVAAIFPDVVRVAGVLLRALLRRPCGALGPIVSQRAPLNGNAATDAGRRAVVTLALSAAPNGYVVGAQEERGTLLLHRLFAPSPDENGERPR